jgi:hypothetical protein
LSKDIFNLLAESSHLEINDNSQYRIPILGLVAINACGAQIDTLVHLGADIHLGEASGAAAIHYAAWFGNYSTYSALSTYYNADYLKDNTHFASQLLLETIYGRVYYVSESVEHSRNHDRIPEHEKVMVDILRRGVGPRTKLRVKDSVMQYRPPGIHYQEYAANELAAALGPETEAWYLVILHHCGLLAHGELQKLHGLAEEGHVDNGFVYDIEEPMRWTVMCAAIAKKIAKFQTLDRKMSTLIPMVSPVGAQLAKLMKTVTSGMRKRFFDRCVHTENATCY